MRYILLISKKKRVLFKGILAFLLSVAVSSEALATVVGGYIFESPDSRVFINYFVNHDYYSRDIPFKYAHEVEALETIQKILVNSGRIQDIPILIFPPSQFFTSPFQRSSISIKKDCSTKHGDVPSDNTFLVGTCYEIYLEEESTHENFLALVLELQEISVVGEQKEVLSIDELKLERSKELKEFQDISFNLDQIFSPDRTFAISSTWKGGGIQFELMNFLSDMKQSLEPLNGYVAVQPIWSSDSRYIAYASLEEIKIFDVSKNTTETISTSLLFDGAHIETLISFHISPNKLIFAGDTNLLSGYKVYEFDLKSRDVRPVTITAISVDKWPVEWMETAFKYQIDSQDIPLDTSREQEVEPKEIVFLSTQPPQVKVPQESSIPYDLLIMSLSVLLLGGLGGWLFVRARKAE